MTLVTAGLILRKSGHLGSINQAFPVSHGFGDPSITLFPTNPGKALCGRCCNQQWGISCGDSVHAMRLCEQIVLMEERDLPQGEKYITELMSMWPINSIGFIYCFSFFRDSVKIKGRTNKSKVCCRHVAERAVEEEGRNS